MTTPCPNRSHSPRLNARAWSCPECDAGAKVSEQHRALSAALDARDRGMASARSAHVDEAARVEAAILRLVATGRPFSANDARPLHGVRGGVVGATFTSLVSRRVIQPVGEEVSTDRGTHGKRVTRYVGAERGAA